MFEHADILAFRFAGIGANGEARVARSHAGQSLMSLTQSVVPTEAKRMGELALGNLRQREIVLNALSDLPHASAATELEVLHFIDRHSLFGRGIGYGPAHLLAAVPAGAEPWTKDKGLQRVAVELALAMTPAHRRPS